MVTPLEWHKSDPRLIREAQRIEAIGSDEPLSVIIDCAGHIAAPKGVTRAEALQRIQEETEACQRPVIAELQRLGVAPSDIKQEPLSNSISVSLRLRQLVDITRLDLVKRIRLSTIDHVAL